MVRSGATELNTFLENKNEDIRFLILEPSNQVPKEAYMTTIFYEDQISELLEEKKFGETIVQKRRKATVAPGTDRDTQHLTDKQKADITDILKTDHRYRCDLAG
jgi:hypothetical protein